MMHMTVCDLWMFGAFSSGDTCWTYGLRTCEADPMLVCHICKLLQQSIQHTTERHAASGPSLECTSAMYRLVRKLSLSAVQCT